ncbi:16S rRNA processing protein RimM [Alteromonadaceae bacterium Bs31]|nr:16S rRNA processing protein RimM [Alteromonadaceae bacterium Bs31]
MTAKRSNLISVGRLSGVFGIKGWLKLKSFTEPEEGIFEYSPWWLKTRHGVKSVEIDAYQQHAGGLIVHIVGIDDRDEAASYTLVDVAVEKAQLPELEGGEYYWHQLMGLKVVSEYEQQNFDIGTVERLLETGANDVLVVKASDTSIDDRERLVPYVPEQYVLKVDLDAQEIRVSWDPDF